MSYRERGPTFSNLVGVLPGTDRRLEAVLIGAHADDNAAAVAIALLAAEKLKAASLSRDIVIALFDAEEPPYFHSPEMGSTRFYQEQRREQGFHVALIMDLVGHDVELPFRGLRPFGSSLANLLFVTGAESHASLPQEVKTCLPGAELPLVASLNRNVGDMSDHHAFRLGGVPYLFFSCGRWQHNHQETDTPDRLNYDKMARICKFLVQLCQMLAVADLSRSDHLLTPETLDMTDTTSLEIELMEAVFGSSLDFILTSVSMSSRASRRDLDELAARLQSLFEI